MSDAGGQNVLQNAGFDDSSVSPSPWTISGATDNFKLETDSFPRDGTNHVSVFGNATLSQRTSAKDGLRYDISFWAFVADTQPETMFATFGTSKWTFEVPAGSVNSGPWNMFSASANSQGNDLFSLSVPGVSPIQIDSVSIVPSNSSPTSTSKRVNATPAIIGGVLGGLALLSLVLIVAVVIFKRVGRFNRNSDQTKIQSNDNSLQTTTIEVSGTKGTYNSHGHQRTVTGSSSAVHPKSIYSPSPALPYQNTPSPYHPSAVPTPSSASQRRTNYRSDDMSQYQNFSPPPKSQSSTPTSRSGQVVMINNFSDARDGTPSFMADIPVPAIPVDNGHHAHGANGDDDLDQPDRYSIYRRKR